MTTPVADYEEAKLAFESLYQDVCERRILLIRGDGGKGKTTLLKHCHERIPSDVRKLRIELRGEAVGIAEIFLRSGHFLKWEQMPRFARKLAELEGQPEAEIKQNVVIGFRNRITSVLNTQDPTVREFHRASLTEAWFEDVDALGTLFLVLFDAYNEATTEVKDWISGPFLARAADSERLRVAIAGRNVPNQNNIEWGDCCREVTLTGVFEARYWLPVVRQMGRRIPAQDEVSWLSGLCHAHQGDPWSIMQGLEKLPLADSGA
jgi:hypothetical protein